MSKKRRLFFGWRRFGVARFQDGRQFFVGTWVVSFWWARPWAIVVAYENEATARWQWGR